jgi:polyhydroxyalkanoate synthesis regulator phasin
VENVSEERKLILQMVAEGKVTPDEADKLLQALEETERTAESAATENVERAGGSFRSAADFGGAIDEAVRGALEGLESTMRSLEIDLDRRLNDPARKELLGTIEEKIRRNVERSVERAARAEERATRAAERASERARDFADRAARKAEERADHIARKAEHMARKVEERVRREAADVRPAHIIKMGIAIDRISVERTETLTLPAQPGDRFVLDNRVGDVRIAFHEGNDMEVTVHKQVWGEDEADANERADATLVRLVRTGADVAVLPIRPTIAGVGVLSVKETRFDYTVRLPHGTNLQVSNKVGDTFVEAGAKVGNWLVSSKVGDVELKVAPEAGFTYAVSSEMGDLHMDAAGAEPGEATSAVGRKGSVRSGRIGDGSGRIEATVKTGNVWIIN